MSVCNIFKQPTASQDTIFYTFSEYSNSLAGVIAGDGLVHSTPSSFIAMNLDDGSFATAGEWLQNYYDDLCCRMRDGKVKDHQEWELSALMQKMESESLSILTSTNFYKGDIDIISNEAIDGMDWCECICWMGPDAKRNISISKDPDSHVTVTRDETDTYISGYSTEKSRAAGVSTWSSGYDTLTSTSETVYKYNIEQLSTPLDEKQFLFNCIVILFDITYGDTTIHDVPMGVYLMHDSITKKCNDSTIYGQGTSWSVKIGMRWANTLDGAVIGQVTPSTESYGNFLKCIDRLNTTIDTMNEMTAAFNKLYNGVRDMIYTDSAMKSGTTYWKSFNNKSNSK